MVTVFVQRWVEQCLAAIRGLRVSTSVLCTSKARSVNAGSREAEELTDWQCCQSVRQVNTSAPISSMPQGREEVTQGVQKEPGPSNCSPVEIRSYHWQFCMLYFMSLLVSLKSHVDNMSLFPVITKLTCQINPQLCLKIFTTTGVYVWVWVLKLYCNKQPLQHI